MVVVGYVILFISNSLGRISLGRGYVVIMGVEVL